MPLYIYECEKCEYKFESFHSMNEELHNCEKCSSDNTLKKVPQLLTSYGRQKSEREYAGERVERFIEDSRKLLLDSKNELKGKTNK